MNKELKPCPFCGKNAEIGIAFNALYIVECQNCFCRANIGGYDNIEKAIEAWNRRVCNE